MGFEKRKKKQKKIITVHVKSHVEIMNLRG